MLFRAKRAAAQPAPPPAPVVERGPVTPESLGQELRESLRQVRVHSISIHDDECDALWLSEGVLGPDEHSAALEAMGAFGLDPNLGYFDFNLGDARSAAFFPSRSPYGEVLGLAMVIADSKWIDNGQGQKLGTPEVRAILQRLSIVLRPPSATQPIARPDAAMLEAAPPVTVVTPPPMAERPIAKAPIAPPAPAVPPASRAPAAPVAPAAPAARAVPSNAGATVAPKAPPRPAMVSAPVPDPAGTAMVDMAEMPIVEFSFDELLNDVLGESNPVVDPPVVHAPVHAAAPIAAPIAAPKPAAPAPPPRTAAAAPAPGARAAPPPAPKPAPIPAAPVAAAPMAAQVAAPAATGATSASRMAAQDASADATLYVPQATVREIALHVQQLHKLRSGGRTRRYEVLLRSRSHPDADAMGETIAQMLAAQGTTSTMDRYIAGELVQWLSQNPAVWDREPASFSVNLALTTMTDEQFLPFVSKNLSDLKVSPEVIGFEVPERAFIEHPKHAERFVKCCEELGCFLVLDDFTLHSDALPFLASPAVRLVKIDARLTTGALKDKLPQAMVIAISQAAKVLGVHCVAKRVDSQVARQWLSAIGIDFAQGFLLEKPQPIDGLALEVKGGGASRASAVRRAVTEL